MNHRARRARHILRTRRAGLPVEGGRTTTLYRQVLAPLPGTNPVPFSVPFTVPDRHLWYDRQGRPITSTEANALLSDRYKRVADTTISSASDPEIGYRVSTVWLGLDHQWNGGDPLIFETMVFGDNWNDVDQVRYTTEAEAAAGHADMVTLVAATVPDEIITQAPAPSTVLTDGPSADTFVVSWNMIDGGTL